MSFSKRFQTFCLENFSKQPIVCVDVGAVGGPKFPWSEKKYIVWKGFEPQENASDSAIEKNKEDNTQIVLSDTVGDAILYVTQHEDNASLLKPNMEFLSELGVAGRYEIKKEISVKTNTLDLWFKDQELESIDFLKIDTQGTEMAVLFGGQEVISSKVLGVDIEINFAERYKGQGYFSEVDNFMREKGFVLFDIQRRYFKRKEGLLLGFQKGQLTHGTALYLRSSKNIQNTFKDVNTEQYRLHILKLIALAFMYGYADYALSLANKFKKILGQDKYEIIKKLGEENICPPYLVPSFMGRYRMYRFFKFMALIFKPVTSQGNSGDEDFGNIFYK